MANSSNLLANLHTRVKGNTNSSCEQMKTFSQIHGEKHYQPCSTVQPFLSCDVV